MTRRYHAPASHRLIVFLAAAPFVAVFIPTMAQAGRGSASVYVKEATWAETMLACRANLPSEEEAADEEEVSMGPWYTTGPLPTESFGEALFPEQGVDLEAKGPDGKSLWQQRAALVDGKVHSLPTRRRSDSTYLFRTIRVKRATKLPAGFGSDDSLAVWLNGKRIVNFPKNRGVAPDSDRAVLKLTPGENRLLCKVYNISGAHGFYFSTAIKAGALHSILWKRIDRDFPLQCGRMRQHLGDAHLRWFDDPSSVAVEKELIDRALGELGSYRTAFEGDLQRLVEADTPASDVAWLEFYQRLCRFDDRLTELERIDVEALRLAIEDMSRTFGSRYPHGKQYLDRLAEVQRELPRLQSIRADSDTEATAQIAEVIQQFVALKREAMLANPLLDFDKLLVLRRNLGAGARTAMSRGLGLPSLNSHTHDTIPHNGWDNEIAVLSDLRGEATLETLYKPPAGEILCEMDLHFDAGRVMFSSIGTHDRWQLFEMNIDGSDVRQLTPDDVPDVDFFDSCYLPGGKIATTSTATFQGLPCENGGKPMACLYLLDPRTKGIRQLTFEQDSDWCPTVLNNGRLMYLRWEYTDAPHYFTRILFHCNPDGTNQSEYYGSNSYFPNAFYYARPIPGHPTMVVGIVGGHHGISRSGRLLIVDPAQGRHEADGVVQEIPGRGKPVEPIIRDRLVDGVWPQFLHPYPLSEKYHLVAGKMTASSVWGIYLVDVFDNMTLIKELPDGALLEPMPLRAVPTPPVVPERIDPRRGDALVYLTDVYTGPGLKDIPPGAVKRLRLFSYHYAHVRSGGHTSVGVESSWDVKRILGTVPVENDGSALFRIPANTPISIQPLDEKGRALQIMRSWMVGMPGETVSCIGCHEKQNDVVANRRTTAGLRKPSSIDPWYGPPRPFSYQYEVQPVLDKYCVGCHDGEHQVEGTVAADLRGAEPGVRLHYGQDKSYQFLQKYVRRPGPESDYHLTEPMEYHASTSELIQMLEKGHHNVALDEEAWQRLTAWIDLNAPHRGKWAPPEWRGQDQIERRIELAKCYANVADDPESEYDATVAAHLARGPIEPVMPEPLPKDTVGTPQLAQWSFSAADAREKQARAAEDAGAGTVRTIELTDGVTIELSLIPPGRFVMGSTTGSRDEGPPAIVDVEKPFWMATCEVSNQQFALFDPAHDSRYIDRSGKDHSTRGHAANLPEQPVIRVTWQQAQTFCRWLSEQTGETFELPSEAQWEWACRAGSDSAMWYGGTDENFAKFANLADQTGGRERVTPFPFIAGVNDGTSYPRDVTGYEPNPWALKNMHGNVAEWTRSSYAPYPYDDRDGREDMSRTGRKVVRGGSWTDRPLRATSSFRLPYASYQRVVNVGFRVVCEVE